MVWIHRLVLPLRQASLVRCPGHLVRLMWGQAGLVRAWCGQHLLEPSEFGWSPRRQKRFDDDRLQARPIDVQAGGCPIAGGQRRAGIPARWCVRHAHLGAATAAHHEASSPGMAVAWRPTSPPGQRARMIHHTGLIRQTRLPTDVGRIPVLMDGRPGVHRPPHVSDVPRPALGVRTATPVDKGARVGRVVQDPCEGCLGRVAPEHLPRL